MRRRRGLVASRAAARERSGSGAGPPEQPSAGAGSLAAGRRPGLSGSGGNGRPLPARRRPGPRPRPPRPAPPRRRRGRRRQRRRRRRRRRVDPGFVGEAGVLGPKLARPGQGLQALAGELGLPAQAAARERPRRWPGLPRGDGVGSGRGPPARSIAASEARSPRAPALRRARSPARPPRPDRRHGRGRGRVGDADLARPRGPPRARRSGAPRPAPGDRHPAAAPVGRVDRRGGPRAPGVVPVAGRRGTTAVASTALSRRAGAGPRRSPPPSG